jgi:spore coat protein U-like protein
MALARISDLTAGDATSGEVTSGTLTGGAQSIYLGGTLTVGETQVAGAYTGSVTATVEYN